MTFQGGPRHPADAAGLRAGKGHDEALKFGATMARAIAGGVFAAGPRNDGNICPAWMDLR